jgi:hypothetical protein
MTVPDCESVDEAYSVAEALRVGAATVLDMDREDLEVLVIRQAGSTRADAILYDPMPGGSGLLEQLCARFPDAANAALSATRDCPAACERSCIDCLQTFRNAFFHRYLDRHLVVSRFEEWGATVSIDHRIPARLPTTDPDVGEMPVNRAEALLRHLLSRAGFPEPDWHRQIFLGRPLGSTTPECFWPLDDDVGVCLYLDGLSAHIHGNPATREHDRAVRDELRGRHFEVVEIAATQLMDRDSMSRHFARLARLIIGRDKAETLRRDPQWFSVADVSDTEPLA